MGDFDDRFRQLKSEQVAREAERRRALSQTADDEQTAWNKLTEVGAWATARYQAAGVRPTPVYTRWQEAHRRPFKNPTYDVAYEQVASAHLLLKFEQTRTRSGAPANDAVHDQAHSDILAVFGTPLPPTANDVVRYQAHFRLLITNDNRFVYATVAPPGQVCLVSSHDVSYQVGHPFPRSRIEALTLEKVEVRTARGLALGGGAETLSVKVERLCDEIVLCVGTQLGL